MKKPLLLIALLASFLPGPARAASAYDFRALLCVGNLAPEANRGPDFHSIGLKLINRGSNQITDILGQRKDRPVEWIQVWEKNAELALAKVKQKNEVFSVSSALKVARANGQTEVYFENWGRKQLDLFVTGNQGGRTQLRGTLLGMEGGVEYLLTCEAE